MASSASFLIKYDGDAMRDGRMSVNDLAPALLSLGQLIEEANRTLNGSESEVQIQVRADLEHGSFGVHIDVLQDLLSQGVALAGFLKIHGAKEIADAVGLTGKIAMSFLKALVWARGKRVRRTGTVLKNGNVEISVEGDNNAPISVTVVTPEVAALLENGKARIAAKGIVRPLDKSGIDSLALEENGETSVAITKEEARAISAPSPDGDVTEYPPEERWVAVSKSWVAPGNKFQFRHGKDTFNAHITDPDFWRAVEKDEIRFSKHTSFRVLVTRSESTTPEGAINVENTVTKILDYRPAPEQGVLSLDDDDTED